MLNITTFWEIFQELGKSVRQRDGVFMPAFPGKMHPSGKSIMQSVWGDWRKPSKASGHVFMMWTRYFDALLLLCICVAIVLSDVLIKSFESLIIDVTMWLPVKRSISLTGLNVEFYRYLRIKKKRLGRIGQCF